MRGVDPDGPTVPLDYVSGDGKPQSGAAIVSCACFTGPGEPLEHPVVFFGRGPGRGRASMP